MEAAGRDLLRFFDARILNRRGRFNIQNQGALPRRYSRKCGFVHQMNGCLLRFFNNFSKFARFLEDAVINGFDNRLFVIEMLGEGELGHGTYPFF